MQGMVQQEVDIPESESKGGFLVKTVTYLSYELPLQLGHACFLCHGQAAAAS